MTVETLQTLVVKTVNKLIGVCFANWMTKVYSEERVAQKVLKESPDF